MANITDFIAARRVGLVLNADDLIRGDMFDLSAHLDLLSTVEEIEVSRRHYFWLDHVEHRYGSSGPSFVLHAVNTDSWPDPIVVEPNRFLMIVRHLTPVP